MSEKGGFKKGHDPRRNVKGRPRGKANKSTEQIRRALQSFIEENLPRLQVDFDALDTPAARLGFLEKLIKHVMPPPLHPLEHLTEEQLNQIIDKLRKGQI